MSRRSVRAMLMVDTVVVEEVDSDAADSMAEPTAEATAVATAAVGIAAEVEGAINPKIRRLPSHLQRKLRLPNLREKQHAAGPPIAYATISAAPSFCVG